MNADAAEPLPDVTFDSQADLDAFKRNLKDEILWQKSRMPTLIVNTCRGATDAETLSQLESLKLSYAGDAAIIAEADKAIAEVTARIEGSAPDASSAN